MATNKKTEVALISCFDFYMSVTCVFGISFSLNKLSSFFGMSVGV